MMKQQQCGICLSQHHQTRVILAHLRTKIMRQSQEYVPDYQEQESIKDNDGFSRLLVLMFGKNATSHPSFLQCSHAKYSRYFRRKLKCDNLTFNRLCSEIASKIAEKNYHFEILNIQIGSFINTAIREAIHPKANQVAKKISQELQEWKKQQSKRSFMTRPGSDRQNGRQTLEMGQNPFGGLPNYWLGQQSMFPMPWMYNPHYEGN